MCESMQERKLKYIKPHSFQKLPSDAGQNVIQGD